AFLAGHGADVDDAAVVVLEHAGDYGAAAVEGAVEVDVDHAAPLFDGVLPKGGGWAGDAGARDQDVQAAGGAESGFGSTGNIGRIGHIDARGLRAGDPGGCGGERALVAIPQEDTAAFGGYAGGGLPADA